MKKFFVIIILMILMTARGAPESKKILWDNSHVIRPAQMKQIGFMAPVPYTRDFISGLGYLIDYNEGGELSYETIERYDVLVEWVPFTLLTPQEVEAVQRFVKNGGGLILFGEYATTLYGGIAGTSNREGFNSLSNAFEVEYVNHYFYGEYLTWCDHPLTSSMKKLLLTHFGVLQSSSPNFLPIVTTKYDQTVVGAMTYGKGRIVFSTDAFLDENANGDALLLASNAFSWLCEPGGPFRHAQEVRQEASGFLYGGIELFNKGRYGEARQKLLQSQKLYRILREIDDSDTGEKVLVADQYLKRCDTAQRGESLFLDGQAFLQAGEYEKAREAFMQSFLLFEEAGVTKKDEARLLIQKCEEAQRESEEKKAQEEKERREEVTSPPSPSPTPRNTHYYSIGAFFAVAIAFMVVLLKKSEKKEEPQGVEEREPEQVVEVSPAPAMDGKEIEELAQTEEEHVSSADEKVDDYEPEQAEDGKEGGGGTSQEKVKESESGDWNGETE